MPKLTELESAIFDAVEKNNHFPETIYNYICEKYPGSSIDIDLEMIDNALQSLVSKGFVRHVILEGRSLGHYHGN